jgi:hypothetical protein
MYYGSRQKAREGERIDFLFQIGGGHVTEKAREGLTVVAPVVAASRNPGCNNSFRASPSLPAGQVSAANG